VKDMKRAPQKIYEDEATILDIVPSAKLERGQHVERGMVVAQMVGWEYFTLLEAAINQSLNPKPGLRLYIGKDVPRQLVRILRRISYQELTENAKFTLEKVVEEIVKEREAELVEFINTCGPLTPRLHALEALPGVGKKISMRLIEERSKAPFTSFKDIEERAGIQNFDKMIIKRIIEELSDPNAKYWLFTRPPHPTSYG
jgi:putative nucleotide binding protein